MATRANTNVALLVISGVRWVLHWGLYTSSIGKTGHPWAFCRVHVLGGLALIFSEYGALDTSLVRSPTGEWSIKILASVGTVGEPL